MRLRASGSSSALPRSKWTRRPCLDVGVHSIVELVLTRSASVSLAPALALTSPVFALAPPAILSFALSFVLLLSSLLLGSPALPALPALPASPWDSTLASGTESSLSTGPTASSPKTSGANLRSSQTRTAKAAPSVARPVRPCQLTHSDLKKPGKFCCRVLQLEKNQSELCFPSHEKNQRRIFRDCI